MIKPVEMLSMAPKSWETSNQNVARIQKQDAAQIHFTNEFGKEVKHNSERPIETSKADSGEYRYGDDTSGGKGAYYENPRGKKKTKEKKEDEKDFDNSHHVDIRI